MRCGIFLLLLLLSNLHAFAQAVFYSNGATIVNSTLLKINGSFQNSQNGVFQQNDTLHITGNFLNNASFNNTGNIQLEGNFTNNGELLANQSGSLLLMGNVQTMQGDSIIFLNHLEALGNGNKILQRDVQTKTINITDKEISLNNHILFVSSNAGNALSRTTGFFSAAQYGALKRKLSANIAYSFPLGWGNNYSPITLTIPTDSAEIEARFAYTDASSEGLPRSFVDSTICTTNPSFYHLINGNGNASYTIAIAMDSSLAQDFTHICSRELVGPATWRLNNNLNATNNGSAITFAGNASSALDMAFLLCRQRPSQPTITGDTSVCEMSGLISYQAGNYGNNQLIWSAAGGNIQGNAESTIVNVNWISFPQGSLSLTATDSVGCSSIPTNYNVYILPVPTAAFTTIPAALPFEDEVYTFINNTTDINYFSWAIENEGQSVDSILQWTFNEPGDYIVTLLVTNNFGCTDTAQKKITIEKGILFPNAFSPNGDGVNDDLSFANSGLVNFSVSIFDRWGAVVFETAFAKLSWNGRDVTGELVPAGTYFYVLKAATKENKYEKRGSIGIYY